MADAFTDPNLCAQCAAKGPTCCNIAAGQEEVCFPLSDAEAERIRDALPEQGGFAVEKNTLAFLDTLKAMFPGEETLIEALFPLGGEHRRLAVDSSGNCRFLGEHGCRLPREARPYYCRLYPLWILGREIMVMTNPDCLVSGTGPNLKRILAALDSSSPEVRDLFGRLRLAWGLPPRCDMDSVKKRF